MWWIVCIIIAIAFPPSIIPMGIVIIFFLVKSSNGKSSSASNHQVQQPVDNRIKVNCPHCNEELYIDGEGNWKCDCGEAFVYRNSRVYKYEDICQDRVVYFVSLLAKVSKSYGNVNADEIDALNEIFKNIELSEPQKREAKGIFDRERANKTDYEAYIRKLHGIIGQEKEVARFLVNCMFMITVANGDFDGNQENLILKTVDIFGLSMDEYAQIKSMYFEDLDKYYQVLGCNRRSTDEEIKKSYRQLMLKFHPDKYASKDLPEEFIQMANDKSREILEAYEKLKQSRKIS